MNQVNRLRSSDSMSDVRCLNQSADLSEEQADRPMFEGSPRQSIEDGGPDDRSHGDDQESSFNIFKPKKSPKNTSMNTPNSKNEFKQI